MKRKLIQCKSKVNNSAIRRESIGGVEHVVIVSYTLPDNIVMNEGLYPAEEIEKGFHTLERTLAPIEHPQDPDGNFISAMDPHAIHNYHAGAFNVNVTRENGRVRVEKYVNVQEAMKTDRGKRLMDRIEEIENNSNPRPIHTSVGVWLDVEEMDAPATNAEGMEYKWVGRNFTFDHDAILLDSVGAAQPSQGVGIAVNKNGDKVEVEQLIIDNESDYSHDEIREKLYSALPNYSWISAVFDDNVVYELNGELFITPYHLDNGSVIITENPVRVERKVEYNPKPNMKGNTTMREMLINALVAAGITVNADISDDELLAKYNTIGQTPDSDMGEVITNAIKPLTDKIEALEGKINEAATAKVDQMVEVITNSGKYSDLSADDLKALSSETLTKMAANCASAHGLPHVGQFSTNANDADAPADMPE